ncbi:MAG TPA: DUF6786 family protein [Capsulimonadaceae bacterium]|jgi:hypothetical protein
MGDNVIAYNYKQAQLTVLPDRGRVLQVSMDGHNAFWVNTAPDGGWNVGGDRLWLGPENDWNWQTTGPADFAKYAVPGAMDPGAWVVVESTDTGCMLRHSGTIRATTSDRALSFTVERSIAIVEEASPRYFSSFIAYQTTNTLHVDDSVAGATADLWILAQVPGGGQLIVGTRMRPEIRHYFGDLPDSMRTLSHGSISFDITGDHMYKAGIAPEHLTGRMAYARQIDGGRLVLYRKIHPKPWLEYCDRPLESQTPHGDAFQVYNDGGEFGGFGEMEHHSPRVALGAGAGSVTDTYTTIVGIVTDEDWANWRSFWL